MPRFDRTGPWGEGPMTGGARGYCNPAQAGYRPPMYGPGIGRGRGLRRGFGPGYGRGRGFGGGGDFPAWGRGYAQGYNTPYPLEPSEELNMLKAEADAMKGGLDEINKRVEELEKESLE